VALVFATTLWVRAPPSDHDWNFHLLLAWSAALIEFV
jgi:hypothetical protein